jgi:hypothetical protein
MAEQYNDAVEKLKDPKLRETYQEELEREQRIFTDSLIGAMKKPASDMEFLVEEALAEDKTP